MGKVLTLRPRRERHAKDHEFPVVNDCWSALRFWLQSLNFATGTPRPLVVPFPSSTSHGMLFLEIVSLRTKMTVQGHRRAQHSESQWVAVVGR